MLTMRRSVVTTVVYMQPSVLSRGVQVYLQATALPFRTSRQDLSSDCRYGPQL